MGVKKSTVKTMARSSLTRYTAASSAVSRPTIRLGSLGGSSPRTRPRMVRSSPGESLQAQPAPWEKRVRRTGESSDIAAHGIGKAVALDPPQAAEAQRPSPAARGSVGHPADTSAMEDDLITRQ